MATLQTQTAVSGIQRTDEKNTRKIFISCIFQGIFSVFSNVNEYLQHLQSVQKPISLAHELGMMPSYDIINWKLSSSPFIAEYI